MDGERKHHCIATLSTGQVADCSSLIYCSHVDLPGSHLSKQCTHKKPDMSRKMERVPPVFHPFVFLSIPV